ncbi:hypothetical protein BDR07DRAFT_1383369 [Suillus spraguei]|nr:hypothetical protein BDR07DRAFT_1383369 [Suillus spraguei]
MPWLLDSILSSSIMPTTVIINTSPEFKKSTKPKSLNLNQTQASLALQFAGRRGEDSVAKSSFAAQHNIKEASLETLQNTNFFATVTIPSKSVNIPSQLDDYLDNLLCETADSNIPITGRHCKRVLDFITNSEKEVEEFSDIYPENFETISHIIEQVKTTKQKPRFTYDYINCHLLIKMPSHVHEIPCTMFKAWFDRFLESLDFNCTLVDANVFMNAEVKMEELSTIPDMAMSLIIGNPRRPLKEVFPVLIESTFSQHTNLLIMKLRKQILAKPEVLMNTLLKEIPACSFNSFLKLQSVNSKSTDPITIAGHQWLGFQTVEIWVWVRGDSPINVNFVTRACMTCSRLYPDPCMDTINAMINKGLHLVKDHLGSLCKEWCQELWPTLITWHDCPTNEPPSSNSCSRTQPNVEVSNSSAKPGASNTQQDGKSKSRNRGKQRTDRGKGKGKSK